jgi:DNA-binding XRE family transcriptional regulator
MKMRKAEAIKAVGSTMELARILNITPEAIYQWEKEIPELRVWQLIAKRPDLAPYVRQ